MTMHLVAVLEASTTDEPDTLHDGEPTVMVMPPLAAWVGGDEVAPPELDDGGFVVVAEGAGVLAAAAEATVQSALSM